MESKGIVRRVAALFKPYRWQVAVVLASIFVTAGLGVAPAFLTKAIINRAIIPHDLHLLWELALVRIDRGDTELECFLH